MAEEHIRVSGERISPTEIQPVKPAGTAVGEKPEEDKETPLAKDPLREVVETVVFVIVLVLLLKTFIAEAFVIPTGSMATTLFGHHIKVTCPSCGYPSTPLNASGEVEMDPQIMSRQVTGGPCQNCGFPIPKEVIQDAMGKSP
jgi:hypothetical protein